MAPEVAKRVDRINWYMADVHSMSKVVLEAALLSKITNDSDSIKTSLERMRDESIYSFKLIDCLEKCLN